MPSKRVPSPHVLAHAEMSPYNGPVNAEMIERDINNRYGRATVARVTLTGADGGKASTFLTVAYRNGRWYAEVDHDATDYNTDTVRHRRASIPLTFFRAEK